MKIHNLFLLLITGLSVNGHASAGMEATVCYTQFREEMVTAALTTGKEKNLFTQNGVTVKWEPNVQLTREEAGRVKSDSNLNPSQAPAHFVNSISEVALLQSAQQKKCDFVSTTFEAVLGANVDSKTYAPVAVYRYGKDYDTHLVVRSKSNIKTIQDLKGKVVRYNQVGSILPFENLLAKAGVKPNEVKYDRSGLAALVKDLDQGRVDAVLSYNPTIPLLLGSQRVRILEKNLFSGFYKQPVPHSILLVRRELMTENKPLFTAFMKAFAAASKDLSSKPENMVNANPEVKKLYTPPEIEKSLSFITLGNPLLVTEMTPKAFYAEAHFDEYAAVLKEHGFIKNSVSLASWNE